MERMACVNLPELPLQMLLREHPEWNRRPAAVVDRDHPNGVLLWANEQARRHRILPGLRYATGLSLCRDLCVGTVSSHAVSRTIQRLIRLLEAFSPCIEPAAQEPGVFWVVATGQDRLRGSFENWATTLRQTFAQAGFQATVAVGFSRFGCYAAAKTKKANFVFRDATQEQTHLRATPIECLGLEIKARDTLRKLGVTIVGDFIDLPADAVHRRFGAAAFQLHRLARDKDWTPLIDHTSSEPIQAGQVLDYSETNFDRLQNLLQPLVRSILSRFYERREALAKLRLSLTLDDRSNRHEQLAPATPTLNEQQLLSLLRLRLESTPFPTGVVELKLQGTGSPATSRQMELFPQNPGRDPHVAQEALARIRAELGNDAVMRAQLCEAHLPESRFEWRAFEKFATAQPVKKSCRPLVRRLFTQPATVPARPRQSGKWLVTGTTDGAAEEIIGPQIIEGGWWRREVSRAYYYVRTRSGRWLWIYHDRKRRRWFLHGEVE